ncbi:FAD/NAD(P)-binding protein [Pontibacter fetidus]|uniref:FAD-dependent oxidoreductase n=1 Tax=Pontibacter fetidus TaxID=2700082 RepID=A0A6B2GZU4_9BACT|nr:FAD/NAD(P)-binding protein [Pontibacter fetidus]NDK55378.1 FAD-dependent oxidoreductase [Pontibacter fetidus]
MTFAIIGAGLSGTLTAIQLLRSAVNPTTIYLIEQDRYRVNKGIAYSSQLNFQPLNVPAAAMSIFPDQPLDFYNWLTQHQHHYKADLRTEVTPHDFIPRFIFGDYLKARFREAVAAAAVSVKVVTLFDEAVALKKQNGSFKVSFKNTKAILANSVVLALGNFPPGQLPIPNQSFYKSSHYFASPWSAKVLSGLKPDDALLLIGSSLTMVDLAGSLAAQGHKGKIYVVSRHGLLPQPFDVNTPPYPPFKIPLYICSSALEVFRYIRKEIKAAVAQGYTWRSVLDAMRNDLPTIWQAFTWQEKKRFLRHIRPYWEVHRHRMPASSAILLNELQAKGQLEVIAANIVDMQEETQTAKVILKKSMDAAPLNVHVNRVINCTGPLADYTKIKLPLIQQMLVDGLLTPDELRLGLQTDAYGTVIGSNNLPVTGIYTLGPPRKAMLYESTALREIRQQALELSQRLLQETKPFLNPDILSVP